MQQLPTRFIHIQTFLLCGILACSCQMLMPKKFIIGIYHNEETGEYFEFRDDNAIVYTLNLDQQGLIFEPKKESVDGEQTYQGRYRVNRNGSVKLILASSHLGLFAYEFSHNKNQLIIKHRLTGRVSVLTKM